MADVIPFQRPEPEPRPTMVDVTGTAQCFSCKAEWAAQAPVGSRWLECPSCGTMKGRLRHAVEASEGDTEYQCSHCGSNAFVALKRLGFFYFLCMGCGFDHTESLFG